jgi:Fe-S cluster biosynthesis and repair protein YggX
MGSEEAISAVKSFLELASEILDLVQRAKRKRRLERRVLSYLSAAQKAVYALGIERQSILTDARRCDVRKKSQVKALCKRLERYLFQDNVRPGLDGAISGLEECLEPIKSAAQGLRWRKRDKQAAVRTFLDTLSELRWLLRDLDFNFFPGGSGIGVQTLMPIYDLIYDTRERYISKRNIEYDAVSEDLGELVLRAISDRSNEEWIRIGGEVEALITKLQLAFSVDMEPAELKPDRSQ